MTTPSNQPLPTANQDSARHAEVAALPLAAAATLAVARILPVEFPYTPNELGIVSVSTMREYAPGQEIFWFLFATAFGLAAAIVIAALLRKRRWNPGRGIALEATATLVLVLALVLPGAFALLAFVPVVGLIALARPASAPGAEPMRAQAPCELPAPSATRRVGLRGAAWGVALLAIALAMNPWLPVALSDVLSGVPDSALTSDGWGFHAEIGQHLAWCDAILDGRMQGRDYFSLYGPYLDLGLVGLWAIVGRSIAAANLYAAGMFVTGYLAALFACWMICRRKWAALSLVAIAPGVNLRYGMGLLAISALVPWLRGGARAWCGVAGLIGGCALFFSQEFGMAFALTAALAFLVRGDGRAVAWFAAGLVVPVAPLVVWFLANDALDDLARDMASYPALMAAGFGKIPFLSLFAELPLGLGCESFGASSAVRTAYLAPALCTGALALCVAAAPFELGRAWRLPIDLRRAWRACPDVFLVALIAFFGLVSFRSALGRSDALHVQAALGGPAILLVLALDRTLPLLAAPRLRATGAWRVLLVFSVAWFGVLPQAAACLTTLRASVGNATELISGGFETPRGSARVNEVADWIRNHTAPDDTVAFVPTGAGYLYLTERRDPTRFVLSHQMVTDAHRAEALADMKRSPPRYVVFDPAGLRIDRIPDRVVLGPELSDWIDGNYELETTIRRVAIRRYKSAARVDPKSQ